MKILSRDFSIKEKILLLVLTVFLLGLCYFQFLELPMRNAISSAQSEQEGLEYELEIAYLQLSQLQSMQSDLDSVMASDNVSIMPSYNNSKAELKFLNDIMDTYADQYEIHLSEVTRDSDQIRRKFTIKLVTADYTMARRVINSLESSEDRCRVQDLKCTTSEDNLEGSVITLNFTVVFYETMVGGTEDGALPEDSAGQSSN